MVSRFTSLFKREGEHSRVRNLSSDYIEGELDQEEVEAVESHLDMCPPCRTFFNTLKATIGLLGSSKRHEPPRSFRERLQERLRLERES